MKRYTGVFQLIILLAICFLPSIVHAQPDPGGDPDATVPIDGGLSILAVAGVSYGVKKIRDYRKKKNEENIS